MSSDDNKPFDEGKYLREEDKRINEGMKKGLLDTQGKRRFRGRDKVIHETKDYKVTKQGAFRTPANDVNTKQQIWKVVRTAPHEAVQEMRISNKDESVTAVMPLNKEWYALFGDKMEIYIVGIMHPWGLQVLYGWIPKDPANPWEP